MAAVEGNRRWLAYAFGWIAIFAGIGPVLGIIVMGVFIGPFAWFGIIIGFPLALLAGVASAPIAAWRYASTGLPTKRFAATLGLVCGLLMPIAWIAYESGTAKLWDNWLAPLCAFAGFGSGLIAAHTLQRPDARARWKNVVQVVGVLLLIGVVAYVVQVAAS